MDETRMMSLPSFLKVAVMTIIVAVIASSTWAAVEAGRVFQSDLDFVSATSRLSCVGDAAAAAAPALFVFGSSYMDVGENFAAWPFRSAADFLPYGVDFLASTPGRASNGRLIIDHISEGLSQELLSPYISNAGASFQHGVNFASGGATVCNYSVRGDGYSSYEHFSLSVQVDQFRVFRQQALSMYNLKQDAPRLFPTPDAFSKGVYIIEIGNSDYHGVSGDRVDALIPVVLQNIELEVRALHNEGARTIVIMEAFPTACFPRLLGGYAHLDELNEDGCIVPIAKTIEKHNAGLKVMVANLNAEFAGAKVIVFSLHDVYMSAIRNPSKFGLKYVHKACCGYSGGDYNINTVVYCGHDGILNGELQKATVCENRSEYMMWDGVHPTDTFAFYIAQAFLRGENMQPAFHIKEMCWH